MRLLVAAVLALAASPAYAGYNCQTAEEMMVKSAKVLFETASQAGIIDAKTAAVYEESSNIYFACQKSQQWFLTVAPPARAAVVAQTQGQAFPH